MATPDHRPRVAAQRRERMRARLLDSAFQIAAARGPAAVSIDEVVVGAGASRGSFYKYFESPLALLEQLASELASELIRVADPLVKARSDPAERLAAGMCAVLRLVRAHPVLGAFVARAGWPLLPREHSFFALVAPDITAGIRQGRFARMHAEVALNLVAGTAVGALHALSAQQLPRDFETQVAAAMLRGLGLDAADALRAAQIPTAAPVLEADSLLGRLLVAAPG